GQTENWAMDCAGDCFGNAVVDDCDVCSGGSSGHEANSDQDCNGDCFGSASEDICGVCDDDPGNDNETCSGCTDPEALNYDPDALVDDESCIYPFVPDLFHYNMSTMQMFYFFVMAELDGIELTPGDWIGVFNGDLCVGAAPWDGPYTDVPAMGDDGSPGTDGYLTPGDIPTFMIYDSETGTYFEAFPSEYVGWANFGMPFIDLLSAHTIIIDCAGIVDGSAFIDDCGECVGGTTGQTENWAMDCAGECFGNAVVDDCDVCSGGNSGHEANSDQDCNGDCFGEAFTDECGECVGGLTGQTENWALDCAGECFGNAIVDDCDVCSGGTSGHEANSDQDCNGDCFGEAFTDDCGVCSGGNSGHEANSDQDCAGDCFGNASMDDCGVCDTDAENDNACFGCTDPGAENYDPDASIDDGSCSYQVTTSYALHEGNNLIGFAGIPDDPTPSAVLAPIAENVIAIFGEGLSAVPHPFEPGEWLGNLTEFEAPAGYWFRMGEDDTLEVTALPTPTGLTHHLHLGNNLISFTGIDGTPLAEALPDEVEPLISVIIGEGVSAVHHPVYPEIWVGNLQTFDHTMGYWFRLDADADMVYVTDGLSRLRQNDAVEIEQAPFGFDFEQSTQQAFYYFSDVIINSEPLTEDQWIIAYNGDSVVGAGRWSGEYTVVPVMGYDGGPNTEGYCGAGDIPSFRIFDERTGALVNVVPEETPVFENNAVYMLAAVSAEEETPVGFSMIPAYPNPFNPVTTLAYQLPTTERVQIGIYDMTGQEISSLVDEIQTEGYHQAVWDGSRFASGIYFAKITVGESMITQKLLLVK
ncbi:MAG: T9SS type A sorting domain-containing protein, partial [FCB group bacterium]|nr:T9SS type A sorting domain-containing protein [FCB group bacterium]